MTIATAPNLPNLPAADSDRRWLLAYDISNDRKRKRVAGVMEGQGLRVQRSVFSVECTQHTMVALLFRLDSMIDRDDCVDAWPVVHHAGLPTPWQRRQQAARLPDYWIM